MTAIRQSTLLNVDSGTFFRGSGGVAQAVGSSLQAARFTNIAQFASLIPDTFWNANQWGDESKTLNDAVNGYKINEAIFTQNIAPASAINSIALSPFDPSIEPNIVLRSFVLFSLDEGRYLHIKPGFESLPPNEMQFAYVNSHVFATRLTNLLPFVDILNETLLGDGPHGWSIEQYYFTKPVAKPKGGLYNYFNGGPTGPRDIERAFLAYSKSEGAYLWIDPSTAGGPPADMIFSFTQSPWEAARFDNTVEFQNILNATYLGGLPVGWELPQFYFNRAIEPITNNPFDQFWCIENNGPFLCLGEFNVCEWLCRRAAREPDFQAFLSFANANLFDPNCYYDSKAFEIFIGQQDYNAYEQWLFNLWFNCYYGCTPENPC